MAASPATNDLPASIDPIMLTATMHGRQGVPALPTTENTTEHVDPALNTTHVRGLPRRILQDGAHTPPVIFLKDRIPDGLANFLSVVLADPGKPRAKEHLAHPR
jgi:hypothetical protein